MLGYIILIVRRSLLCLTDDRGMCGGDSEQINLNRLSWRAYNLRSERIIHGRADIIFILSFYLVEAKKESRQKRLVVKHRKYNLKTAILHCFSIDTAANNTRLYSLVVSV